MNDPRAPDGFSFAERRTWRTVIFSNVLAAMRQIVAAMEDFEIDLEHDNNLVFHGTLIATNFSHIVTTFSRRRRLKTQKVCLGLISSHYKRCGKTAESN